MNLNANGGSFGVQIGMPVQCLTIIVTYRSAGIINYTG
jgi:hypothetical protein